MIVAQWLFRKTNRGSVIYWWKVEIWHLKCTRLSYLYLSLPTLLVCYAPVSNI